MADEYDRYRESYLSRKQKNIKREHGTDVSKEELLNDINARTMKRHGTLGDTMGKVKETLKEKLRNAVDPDEKTLRKKLAKTRLKRMIAEEQSKMAKARATDKPMWQFRDSRQVGRMPMFEPPRMFSGGGNRPQTNRPIDKKKRPILFGWNA